MHSNFPDLVLKYQPKEIAFYKKDNNGSITTYKVPCYSCTIESNITKIEHHSEVTTIEGDLRISIEMEAPSFAEPRILTQITAEFLCDDNLVTVQFSGNITDNFVDFLVGEPPIHKMIFKSHKLICTKQSESSIGSKKTLSLSDLLSVELNELVK